MDGLAFDIAHLLAGGLVLIGFLMLYQDRLYALLNVFALQALVLALWSPGRPMQDAPHLYVTAAIALVLKAVIIPVALHRIRRLGIHRGSRRSSASGSPCWPARLSRFRSS